VPRPQLLFINYLVEQVEFVPAPKAGIRVLMGADYPEPDYSDPQRIRRIDRENLVAVQDYVDRFTNRVIDVVGRYLWTYLREMSWRISPTGPRVLHVLGVTTHEAWSLNRTGVAARLEQEAQVELAEHYSGYYLNAWEYFLSGYTDTSAARAAIAAGIAALTRGIEIARDAPEQ
jgi:hypothetical protein